MDKLNETISKLEAWIDDPNAMDTEIDACLVADSLDLLKEQKNMIDGLVEDQVKKIDEMDELLKEPRKTKDEILLAIVSAIGYESIDDFKKTAEEVGTLDEFVFGMYRSINAVEKLFEKDGEQDGKN